MVFSSWASCCIGHWISAPRYGRSGYRWATPCRLILARRFALRALTHQRSNRVNRSLLLAQQYLELRVHNRQVLVENATDPVDPHDRTLAYLYTLDGDSLQLALLEAGLASAIVIAPNDRHLDEYAAAETRARLAGKGIWGVSTYRPRHVRAMTLKDRGYGFVRGRVQRTVLGKKWFEFHLARNFVILVQRARWQQYFAYSPCRLDRADVVVRGWVSGKGKRLRTTISHPFMLERCAGTGQLLCHWSDAAGRLAQ